MSFTETLRKDMFEARKGGDSSKADILGMALASLKNAQIESDKELTQEQETTILRKEAKKLQDAVEQYEASGNDALAKKEAEQLEIISSYLPDLMDESEIEKIVAAKIEELGASGMQDMGQVMGASMQELKGEADGSAVQEVVKRLLSK